MAWNPEADPFADILFTPTEEQGFAGPDELLRVLGGRGGAGREVFTPMANPPVEPNAAKESEKARQRVNDNSAATGAIAYKDAEGKTVLTNLAKQGGPAAELAPAKFGGAANISTPVFETLSKLRTAQDIPTAQALYDSLQQTVISEKTRLETEAQRFAESKVGTTALEANLRAAEMADKADPAWYPGIGDSPITAQIRSQLGQSRGLAQHEANQFLKANMTYNSLAKVERDASAEWKRLETKTERKELFDYQQQARQEDKKFFQAEKLQEAADALPSIVVKRMIQLDEGSFDPMKPEDHKVTALRRLGQNKDKNFQEAIQAPDEALPLLAMKGNTYAFKLTAKEEAARTGRDEADVVKEMTDVRQKMISPKFVEDLYKEKFKDPKVFATEMANWRAMKQGKADEFSQKNAMLAVEYMKLKKDADFVNNLDSWKSIDPDLNLAIKEAKNVTGAKATFQNVLTAFTMDKDKRELEGSALILRLKQFEALTNVAALKHENSLFGMPDRLGPIQMIRARAATGMGTFLKKLGFEKPGITDLSPAHAYGMAIHNSELGKSARSVWQEMTSAPIDPTTGRPYNPGE